MNPRRSRQRTEMSSWPSSTTITTIITITTRFIPATGPASLSYLLADTGIITITTTIITASIAVTIEVARQRMTGNRTLRVLFFYAEVWG
jgi:hypothetical protein